jgi:3-hydroxypropanoate dehydrogenase
VGADQCQWLPRAGAVSAQQASQGEAAAGVDAMNVDKTMAAPVTAILGYDLVFYERLPTLMPHNPKLRDLFAGSSELCLSTAQRNSSLQGAYMILAARATGLDCGAMSGFDHDAVDREFFASGHVKSNFLCNLGYGDDQKLFPRNPRLDFDEVCTLL